GDMPEPRWHDDDREWKANITQFGADWDVAMKAHPVSDRARAVAVAVFYTAANYNTVYRAPIPFQIYTRAQVFDCGYDGCRHWLTVDVAVRAVDEHFAEPTDGRILPAHVLRKAAVLKLSEEV